MTTVDVRIERLGSGDRLYLHNGLWGPATRVLHAFSRVCQDGRIPSRKWNIAEINEVTTGAVVRQALDSIEDPDWQHSFDSTDRERVTAFLDRIVDSAEYENLRPGGPGARSRSARRGDHLGTRRWATH